MTTRDTTPQEILTEEDIARIQEKMLRGYYHRDEVDALCTMARAHLSAGGWREIEGAPKGVWVEAGMPSEDSPTGWWVCTAIVSDDAEDADHWTDGDLIVHYNGTKLVSGFKGPFTHWRPLAPPTLSVEGQK